MADYFGNLLIKPQTVEHQSVFFKLAVEMIRQAQQQHDILDTIVVVERTGNYHLPPKRAFARAGFETRVVHPFATRQYRMPADPGNKTDDTDLAAIHRAAVNGFALRENPLEESWLELRLLIRHRRDLVRKSSALCCQIREHLEAADRDVDDFGIEPQARIAGGDADRWQRHAAGWRDLGATHLSVVTMGAGFDTPAEHLEAALEWKAALG